MKLTLTWLTKPYQIKVIKDKVSNNSSYKNGDRLTYLLLSRMPYNVASRVYWNLKRWFEICGNEERETFLKSLIKK
jgi:hypothetical protein